MNKENLYQCLKTLSKKEQAVLLNIIKRRKDWEQTHMGMLPFMPQHEVAEWFAFQTSGLRGLQSSHLLRKILSKLTKPSDKRIFLTLDDGKVRKRFGNHPERGITIPGLGTKFKFRKRRPFERRERGLHWDGVKWITPEGGPEAENAVDIQSQIVALRNVGRNRWTLACTDEVADYVQTWLRENLT